MPVECPVVGKQYPAFTIVGMYSAASDVIQHVGLLQRATTYAGAELAVYDQQPPPRLSANAAATMPSDLLGYVDLDDAEIEGFQVEIGKLRTMFEAQRLTREKTYTARPPIEPQPADAGETVLYYRFSCVGFVQHCYRRVLGRSLVDEGALPTVTLDEILAVWLAARNPERRVRMGLPPPGPWRVLLPAHVFHAIDKAGARPFQLPFRAGPQHAKFPKPRPPAAAPPPASPPAATPSSAPPAA